MVETDAGAKVVCERGGVDPLASEDAASASLHFVACDPSPRPRAKSRTRPGGCNLGQGLLDKRPIDATDD